MVCRNTIIRLTIFMSIFKTEKFYLRHNSRNSLQQCWLPTDTVKVLDRVTFRTNLNCPSQSRSLTQGQPSVTRCPSFCPGVSTVPQFACTCVNTYTSEPNQDSIGAWHETWLNSSNSTKALCTFFYFPFQNISPCNSLELAM